MSGALPILLAFARTHFAPSYGGGLTNHLPMCLVALARLGAGDAVLTAFMGAYLGRLNLDPAAPTDVVVDELRAGGVDAMVRARLPALAPGLAGAGFHGAIRLAYAVESGDVDEVHAALAYFADTALVLDVPAGGREADLGVLAERLRAARIEKPGGATLAERLLRVAADPRFVDVVKDLAVDRTTLSQVSALGARWYLAADDFTSLHVLTGAHAARALRRFLDDPAPADRALAVAALASFVACGSPARADARGKDAAEDAELTARALGSCDDHLAKLVVTCRDEERAAGDRIYRIVATRAARRDRA